MRHWALPATAIGAAISISSSGSASPVQGPVSGIYVLDRGESDDVHKAIASAVAVPDVTRITGRLRKSNTPSLGLRLSSSAGRFSIKDDVNPPIVVWISGEPIKWKLGDGQVFEVSAKANGETVSLTFRAVDSERTTVYRSVGQQLVAETTLISPRLSTPLRYKLVYNRAN
ncbi:MAG TPA: hypothetical protein VFQ67_09295 [Allosphingosinicella sp.]|jgi:hypothetical protein|nr:hypothetical protein [Allosphingosinicella sp.]